MFKLILSRIKNRKKAAVSFLIALIILFTVIPIGIAASLKTKSIVTSTVEQHARGSYDLLIRPKGEQTSIEKTLGVVEENYIDGGNGGISLEDWQKISEDSEVEVAAPVASLGYFSGNQTVVQLPLLPHPARFTWQYATSDGLNEYLLDEEKSFVYFEGKEQQYVDYYAPPETLLGINGARMPRSYYQLIAIDPENEQALTGINYSDLYREIEEDSDEERMLKHLLSYRDNPPVIPILQNRDFSVSLKMKLTVEKLNVETAVYKEKYNILAEDPFYFKDPEIEKEFVEELSSEPVQSVESYDIDLSEVQSPFNGQYVQLTDGFIVTTAENGPLSNDSGKYFSASKVPYKIFDDTILVEELDDSTPPVYRTVQEKGDSYILEQSAPFMLWQMGSFSLQKKENQLASSPLGIYGGSPIVTGNGVTLTPTIKPGSFINTGAAGLTTMEAAKIIKGDAPIDAIRIRVAGITEYNTDAKVKIEKLASKYLNQGYVVDIVAGASDRKHAMEVEKIGEVTAPWTTLGIASIITEGINSLTFISIGLFIVFSLLWIGSRLLFEYFGTLDEKRILGNIGWNEKQIQKLYVYEPCLYVLCSGFIVLVIFILFSVTSILYFIFACLLAITLAFIFITYRLLPGFFSENKEKRKSGALFYYGKFIIPTALILLISLILISVQTASIFIYVQEINSSKLGAFTVSTSLPMQLVLLAVTIGLTCISVNNSITLMINERKREFQMYTLIGWTKKMIVKHFGKEVLQWTLVPILFAMLISCLILIMFNFSVWMVIGLCVLFAGLMQVGILILVKSRNYQLR